MEHLSRTGKDLLAEVAQRHGFSMDAVEHMLAALVQGQGRMAQFRHPAFSGAGQWMQGGMTMVSDLFDNALKNRVDRLCTELATLLHTQPALFTDPQDESLDSATSAATDDETGPAPSQEQRHATTSSWWGTALHYPASTGSQNNARYAYFAREHRLAIEDGGNVTIYDTLDHQISGFSQQQGAGGSMACTSQHGTVPVDSLPVVSRNGTASAPPRPATAATPEVPSAGGSGPPSTGRETAASVLSTLEKLAELHQAGIVSAEEFQAKKTQLLERL